MADFLTAFHITLHTEAGYNPGAGEAETYAGIDRSQNPGWSGWATVDAIKIAHPGASVAELDALFLADGPLQTAVQSFYQAGYWDPFQLDAVTDQQVANALFDCAVNPCILSAAKAAQIACNVVQPGLLSIDGQFGTHTLNGINAVPPNLFVTALNGVRIANYYERVNLGAQYAQWLPSWIKRCVTYQP